MRGMLPVPGMVADQRNRYKNIAPATNLVKGLVSGLCGLLLPRPGVFAPASRSPGRFVTASTTALWL